MLITSDKISVRKNVLSPEELEPIQEVMLSEEFPWFINKDNPHKFTHIFWKKMEGPVSPYFPLIIPVLKQTFAKNILQIKAHLFLKTPEIIKDRHERSTDVLSTRCIFSLNDNNGSVSFIDNDTEGGIKSIKSEENQMLAFTNPREHGHSTCTNVYGRVVLIFDVHEDD